MKLLKKIFGGGHSGGSRASSGAVTGEGPTAFVEYVVRELVDDPEAVRVSVDENTDKLVISVRCAKNDMGKVIGRQGRTVSAIRALIASTAKRDGKRVVVDIVD
ncbi:MAG: KH domain-containing protein [Lentisphaeria bacterium]|nr:KH domain-containing protein [Lentisphaeria bacterium]